MLFPLIALLQLQVPAADPGVFHGRNGQLRVSIPSIAADVVIDGKLDEPVWRQASLLTGFSQYAPIDQQPAPDSTDVLVWYSATAIHFGIRAFEPHGVVRATLADRDRVSSDDNIEIHLDTFDERKRAFVFIVNPLGVQADGTKSEGAGMFIPGMNIFPGQNDLSSDFTWQSKGVRNDGGYEVEVRIPFKSLRYPAGGTQNWGVQIVRKVQHSGYELTWTPARKASASFISQEGHLVGMRGMRHGQVVELNPEVTTSVNGAPNAAGDWAYDATPALGGNVKWGLTSNMVLNGTVKPDFSQVEADALQIAGDARFALFYAEKRPFFVDGIEQFNTPNTLVYTRRIVRPTAAAKLTGKTGRNDFALMSAIDDPQTSASGASNPLWNVLRVKRDFGEQSTMGLVVTDREDGDRYNRVVGGDVRYVFGRLYYAEFQAVGSATRRRVGGPNDFGTTPISPLWTAAVDRTGRSWGFHYSILGIDPEFITAAGFVPRTGFVTPNISNRYTRYGKPGSMLERYNVFASVVGTWQYDDFFEGKRVLEDRVSLSNDFTLRGGWVVNFNPALASYAFDPASYSGIYTVRAPGDTGLFRPSDRITTLVVGGRVSTPQFRRGSASLGATTGNDVDFFETSRVRRRDLNASADWRPTDKIRASLSYNSTQFTRRSDGASINSLRIPRVKVEYQVRRPVFVRFVGQYESFRRAPLLDPRTGLPLLTFSDGTLVASAERRRNDFRVDWLFSYRPTPGTVFFAGYGSSLTEPDALAFRDLRRVSDGLFLKGSYLLRL
jgi:hypothetical protein